MIPRGLLVKLSQHDGLNFVLSNRIPRRLAGRLLAWFGRIEHPVVCAASLRVWRLFTELDLSDAREQTFRSLHACFTRELRPGARTFVADPLLLASPCDAIVGACGTVAAGQVLQVKGRPYRLEELLGDAGHAASLEGGRYVTLRLTSAMYHRFHAPHDAMVERVGHVSGDSWNVNPPALARLDRVFCRNERAVIAMRLRAGGHALTLVPVAAVLVAGIRLRFLALPARRHAAPWSTACHVLLRKGEEMGWFEHGSTIIVLAGPGLLPCAGVHEGAVLRAGQALLRLPRC